MSLPDIFPLTAITGGSPRVLSFPITATTSKTTVATSWKAGQVVELVSNKLIVTPDGAADPHTGLVYIAATSSEGIITKAGGYTATAASTALGTVYDWSDGAEFCTRNVVNNSDTNIGPAGSGAMTGVVVGATCDLWRDDTNTGPVSGNVNGDFSFDVNGNGLLITKLLDSNGVNIAESGNSAYYVVAKLLVS